jgi:hypothetical protein
MNTIRKMYCLLVAVLLCLLPTSLLAQQSQPSLSPAGDAPFDSRQGRTIGAPQVLEIPPAQDLTEPPVSDLPPWTPAPAPEQALGVSDANNGGLQPQATMPTITRRNYLGVLYATAEEGPVGVKVLDVLEGSPAARAGFQGVNSPRGHSSDFLKAAIVVLAMSPVGPFAIPLAIAHDIYTNRQSPGDLIVAVDGRQIRDAQEFSAEMRPYQPGDMVVFSVLRGGKSLQITVQLEEEPS